MSVINVRFRLSITCCICICLWCDMRFVSCLSCKWNIVHRLGKLPCFIVPQTKVLVPDPIKWPASRKAAVSTLSTPRKRNNVTTQPRYLKPQPPLRNLAWYSNGSCRTVCTQSCPKVGKMGWRGSKDCVECIPHKVLRDSSWKACEFALLWEVHALPNNMNRPMPFQKRGRRTSPKRECRGLVCIEWRTSVFSWLTWVHKCGCEEDPLPWFWWRAASLSFLFSTLALAKTNKPPSLPNKTQQDNKNLAQVHYSRSNLKKCHRSWGRLSFLFVDKVTRSWGRFYKDLEELEGNRKFYCWKNLPRWGSSRCWTSSLTHCFLT